MKGFQSDRAPTIMKKYYTSVLTERIYVIANRRKMASVKVLHLWRVFGVERILYRQNVSVGVIVKDLKKTLTPNTLYGPYPSLLLDFRWLSFLAFILVQVPGRTF